jgi:hypothetical protein
VEYGTRAKGSFVVTNETIYPLTVVLSPKGFEVTEDGELYDVPLDTTRVHLTLSTLSFRLQPRQAYTVFYEAAADSAPAWFSIWSGISGGRTQSGINLRLELPHVVYLNQKDKLTQQDVTVTSARWRPADREVVLEFVNASRRLGRARAIEVRGQGKARAEGPGFPLFPGGRRRIEIPWTDSLPPASAQVEFDGFKVVAPAFVTDDSPAPPGSEPEDGPPPTTPQAVTQAVTRDTTP